MPDIAASTETENSEALSPSKFGRRQTAMLFLVFVLALDVVDAAAEFIFSLYPSLAVDTIARDVHRWLKEATIFPLPLADSVPGLISPMFEDAPLYEFLDSVAAAIVVAPLTYLVGHTLFTLARRYGWRWVLPGYLVFSVVFAFAWTLWQFYQAFGDAYIKELRCYLFRCS